MQLTVVLRKEVPDEATARSLVEAIKTKLEEYSEVTINASVSETIDE